MTQQNNTQVYTLEQLTAAVNNLSNGVISHEEGIANISILVSSVMDVLIQKGVVIEEELTASVAKTSAKVTEQIELMQKEALADAEKAAAAVQTASAANDEEVKAAE
jgi:hypothetical protein